MKDLFVPHRQSLQLKELGFDEPCFGIWMERGAKQDVIYVAKQEDAWMAEQNDGILAPIFSQAFKWFREKYRLFVQPHRIVDSEGIWYYFSISTKRTDVCGGSFIYEEAELACLDKLIEILKNKQ